jgi:hypothetical protein
MTEFITCFNCGNLETKDFIEHLPCDHSICSNCYLFPKLKCADCLNEIKRRRREFETRRRHERLIEEDELSYQANQYVMKEMRTYLTVSDGFLVMDRTRAAERRE